MLTRLDLHDYQTRASRFICNNPRAALFLDMGLGKTISTLTAIVDLFDRLDSYGVVIFGPLRVVETVWAQEAAKWAHTKHLRICLLRGDSRHKTYLLNQKFDIYLINYESIKWFNNALYSLYLSHGKYPPFDTVVLDEMSMVKHHTNQRFKALEYIFDYLPRRIGLTGTPASNGLRDLFGQYLALDGGNRLGNSLDAFTREFFEAEGYGFKPRIGAKTKIYELIQDITLTMKNEEYLKLPPIIVNDIWIDLPSKAREVYDKAEKEFFVELDSGAVLDINNAAVRATKCLQIANGHVYLDPETRVWDIVHDAKLQALDDILNEAAGSPVLVTYAFQTDAIRIEERYKKNGWQFANLTTTKRPTEEVVYEWNQDQYHFILGHPASIGHGLNLQGGSAHQIAMFGITWRLDLYSQVIARLRRQGQKASKVIVHRILAEGTWDEIVRARIAGKAQTEDDLKNALIAYRKQKGI